MTEIMSTLTGKRLHVALSYEDFSLFQRSDISDDIEPLQLALLSLNKDQTFKAHKHIEHKRLIEITQESWVVISGSVRADYYDESGGFISSMILRVGDCTISFGGGHNYTALEDNTHVYEIKNGPFEGRNIDKEDIK